MAGNDKPNAQMARAKYEHAVVRLADDLERLLKMASHMREALENELFTGMGYKQISLAHTDLKRMTELTKVYEIVVDTKVKFDKAAKALADNMTRADEVAAIKTFLKAASRDERADILSDLRKWMEERPGNGNNGLTGHNQYTDKADGTPSS